MNTGQCSVIETLLIDRSLYRRNPMLDAPLSAAAEPTELINRDVSDLAFMQRVLEQAEDDRNPVLERLRYLSITGMLLDEFYRIRVAALREQIRSGSTVRSVDGRKPAGQLRQADKLSNRLIRRQDKCWRAIQSELRRCGIQLIAAHEVRAAERGALRQAYEELIAPRLRPHRVSSDALLESIRDGDLLLLAELRAAQDGSAAEEFFIPISSQLPRFIALSTQELRYIAVEEAIKFFLGELFGDRSIEASGLARVLREGSLRLFEHGDDLLSQVRDAIERRERADVIRLRVERRMPAPMMNSLAANLGLLDPQQIKALEKSRRKATRSEFVVADAFLGLSDLAELIAHLPRDVRAAHSYPRSKSHGTTRANEFDDDVFAAISMQDCLLHFPYDDFGVIVDLIRRAATDDSVSAIRQTLYRAGTDTPIIDALADAARRGKDVAVVIEVEAREDERRNIALAERLEAAGTDVSLGPSDRKVHAKLLIIERLEDGSLRRYVHCSTGNYSVSTADSYTDICLLSADQGLAADASRLFDHVHEGRPLSGLQSIAVAPFGLRERIEESICREICNARAGRPAAIWLKLNKLSDPAIIRLLYEASEAGVRIEIIVRGVCCLRAGVPGLSECIRVKSVVGRFLEHSRAFCFGNGASLPNDAAEVFISSADLMPHKLDERIEMLVPISDTTLKRRLQQEIFIPYFRDMANSWTLTADDRWVRDGPGGYNVHEALFNPDSG